MRDKDLLAIRERFIRGIPEEMVKDKTGRGWSEWETILDGWSAVEKGAAASAKFLRNEFELSTWWSNTITARYQWMRGLRE